MALTSHGTLFKNDPMPMINGTGKTCEAMNVSPPAGISFQESASLRVK
jgi:hypothetical protein